MAEVWLGSYMSSTQGTLSQPYNKNKHSKFPSSELYKMPFVMFFLIGNDLSYLASS
jgi:hypothetical protein